MYLFFEKYKVLKKLKDFKTKKSGAWKAQTLQLHFQLPVHFQRGGSTTLDLVLFPSTYCII